MDNTAPKNAAMRRSYPRVINLTVSAAATAALGPAPPATAPTDAPTAEKKKHQGAIPQIVLAMNNGKDSFVTPST